MLHSFWTGGSEAYEKGLEKELHKMLRTLEGRRASCPTTADRVQIDAEIARLKADHKSRLATIGRSLF